MWRRQRKVKAAVDVEEAAKGEGCKNEPELGWLKWVE